MKNKKIILVFGMFIFLILMVNLPVLFNDPRYNHNLSQKFEEGYDKLSEYQISAGNEILFEGIESPLNITEKANLYALNQEITVNDQDVVSKSYYLDDEHDWKISKIENTILNIEDTRGWINNSNFEPITVFKVVQTFENLPHPYLGNRNPATILHTINQTDAIAMRVHFQIIDFEPDNDFIYLYDEYGNQKYIDSGYKTDFYSPWINGSIIETAIRSDNFDHRYGFYIDYYEFYNASSNHDVNSYSWNFNYEDNGVAQRNIAGPGDIANVSSMYVGVYGQEQAYSTYNYSEGDYSELQQELSLPRKSVVDAYLSFDYFLQYGTRTNDFIAYFKINDQIVYYKTLSSIVDGGRNTWQSTGNIPMNIWFNVSNVFDSDIYMKSINVSVGLKSETSRIYVNEYDGFQQIVWFDNVSLSLTTIANSSQDGINLTINDVELSEGNNWGSSYLNLTDGWDTNPVILTINTTSPELTFDLNTTLYGYHETKSKIDQLNTEGIKYEILNNGSIFWEFFHNFYMPSQYTDFEITINKPREWNTLSVLDPTLSSQLFEGGSSGADYIKINRTSAIYPGWWTFTMTSPNYLNVDNTKILKDGQVVPELVFFSGDVIEIKTQVNFSNAIPPDVQLTSLNLTILDPEGTLWYQRIKSPYSNGTVFFDGITLSSDNTTGGIYTYELFWRNGTALGGLNSSFMIIHDSSLSLLKPDDARVSHVTSGFVGDIIPLRVYLKDSENNQSISDASIFYNWTTGTVYLEEAASGIYESILDTADLGSLGEYYIFINSSKIGFIDFSINLTINLGEDTELIRLESESPIEMHANSSIKFQFNDYDGDGIEGATVNLDILNPSYYSIQDLTGGTYEINFNTGYFNTTGYHSITFEFFKALYEPKTYIYNFEIVDQSVNLTVYINSQQIQENSITEFMFKETINVSVRVFGKQEGLYISGGNVTWQVPGKLGENLTEAPSTWYNSSFMVDSSRFSTGFNYVYLEFHKAGYKPGTFSFQLLISEQDVNLTVYIESNEIEENSLIEMEFMQTLNISARCYALAEKTYLSGGNIKWISELYQKNFTEYPNFWFNTSIVIDGAYLNPGVNYVSIKFEQDNYVTKIFSFQLFITAQSVNLTVSINSERRSENDAINVGYYDIINISARAFANTEKIYISGGNVSLFISESSTFQLEETMDFWYNGSLIITPVHFSLPTSYIIYVRFVHANYSEQIFSFQLIVTRIAINIIPIGFDESIEGYPGDEVTIQLNLTDSRTGDPIENSSIYYEWNFGIGVFTELGEGIYTLRITLPNFVEGAYPMHLTITSDNVIYQAATTSIVIRVIESNLFGFLMWIIVPSLLGVIGVLGILSIRSYVILPRKRRRESELQENIQVFKDVKSIQSIILMHRKSGIPIFNKNISIFENEDEFLISGFIQAIASFSEEVAKRESQEVKATDKEGTYLEHIIELDFKYFYLLVCDFKTLRVLLVLKTKSSDRLKRQLYLFTLGVQTQYADELLNFTGKVQKIDQGINYFLNQFLFLHYRERFTLNKNKQFLDEIVNSGELSDLEMRVLTIVQRIASKKTEFLIDEIVEKVEYKNLDLVLEAINSLITKKVIVPVYLDTINHFKNGTK